MYEFLAKEIFLIYKYKVSIILYAIGLREIICNLRFSQYYIICYMIERNYL